MALQDCATTAPSLVYEEGTGYLVLTDGKVRQVIARTDGINIYLWWKKSKEEYTLTLEKLMGLMEEARG